MSRSDFTRAVLAHHDNQPQQRALVNLALQSIYEGLDELAKYGHPMKLVPAETAEEPLEWPKMLYHPQIAPNGKVFHEWEKPTEPGWSNEPLAADPNPEPHPDPSTEQVSSAQDASYPKKMYHRDIPGGISVMNAEMEDDYKTRGYTLVPQERGDVSFGSKTAELEGTDGRVAPADGQGSKRSAGIDLSKKPDSQPNPTKQAPGSAAVNDKGMRKSSPNNNQTESD